MNRFRSIEFGSFVFHLAWWPVVNDLWTMGLSFVEVWEGLL